MSNVHLSFRRLENDQFENGQRKISILEGRKKFENDQFENGQRKISILEGRKKFENDQFENGQRKISILEGRKKLMLKPPLTSISFILLARV